MELAQARPNNLPFVVAIMVSIMWTVNNFSPFPVYVCSGVMQSYNIQIYIPPSIVMP